MSTALYDVEEIRAKQTNKKKKRVEYLCKLQNKEEEENVWLFDYEIQNKDVIKDFINRNKDISVKWQWQYFIDKDIDSKVRGLYNYDQKANYFIEENRIKNKKYVFEIETGKYKYDVDLEQMVQTNTKTNTTRLLRRLPIKNNV